MGDACERAPSCTATKPRVLLLCSPCMGHLIPFTELARRLAADHGLAATLLFASATSPPSDQFLALAASVPASVDLIALPAPPPHSLPSSAHVRDRVTHAVRASIPYVRETARAVSAHAPLAALVVDMVGAAPARGVATDLHVPLHLFFTSPWMTLSLLLHLPYLDATMGKEEEFRDAAEPIRLPGCVPVHTHDLLPSMRADRKSDTYASLLAMAKEVTGVDGILVNTFHELEPAVGGNDDIMIMNGVRMPVKIHPVGPLIWTRPVAGDKDRDHKCLMRWLDQQPPESVVYVSFGSGGTLTLEQTTELALGLELSQCRFIWAVKRPDQCSTIGAFFGSSRKDEVETALDFLPEGFIERTRVVGLVMASTWVPQTAILEHPAVGCFVTHCGWNSILESVMNGVPMVAWPLYAEQNMNAAMLEVQVRVAVRVKAGDDHFVSKEEVAAAVRLVMEGDEAERMRKRAGELRERSVHALTKNGSSTRALAQIANAWKCFASLTR